MGKWCVTLHITWYEQPKASLGQAVFSAMLQGRTLNVSMDIDRTIQNIKISNINIDKLSYKSAL